MVASMVLTVASGVLSVAGAILGVAARTQTTKEWQQAESQKNLIANEHFRRDLLDQTARYMAVTKKEMQNSNNAEKEEEES